MLMMMLVAVRDAILVLALAWVGISVEERAKDSPCAGAAQSCSETTR
jgi:hypothetical protein